MAMTMKHTHPQDWANLLLAACLFISPWALAYSADRTPTWNAWACAVIIALLALSALNFLKEWEEWLNLIVGAWVVIAPWALGFTMNFNAFWAHTVLGLLIAASAAWSIWEIRHLPHATA